MVAFQRAGFAGFYKSSRAVAPGMSRRETGGGAKIAKRTPGSCVSGYDDISLGS